MAGNKKAIQPEKVKRSITNQAMNIIQKGGTIREAATKLGMNRHTLYAWLIGYEGEQYQAIRTQLADIMAAETLEVADNEDLSPAHARNSINSRQFILERRFPKQYGRKDQVEVKGGIDIVARLHTARDRIASNIIEVESGDAKVLPSE